MRTVPKVNIFHIQRELVNTVTSPPISQLEWMTCAFHVPRVTALASRALLVTRPRVFVSIHCSQGRDSTNRVNRNNSKLWGECVCTVVCASGWQQVPGLAVCQPCPTGTYKSHTSSLDCTACPTGFTTPFTGSIFPSNCTVPVGSGCSATSCDLGYQCHWDATQAKAVCYCPGTIAGNTCTPNSRLMT